MDSFIFQLCYWVLALITVISALLVASVKNLARATIFLVFFFLGVAGLYFLLNAQFLALIQVMIYAGAISVLFAFVIMLTPELPGIRSKQALNKGVGGVISAIFLILMVAVFYFTPFTKVLLGGGQGYTLAELSAVLFSKYLLPFELVSVILLVALIGAIAYTAKAQERGETKHGPY